MTHRAVVTQAATTAETDTDPGRVPPAPRAAYWFALAAATFGLLAAPIALNVLVDPRDEFPTDLYAPLVPDEYAEKVRLFEAAGRPHGIVVLGSSRVEPFEAHHFGDPVADGFFNFYVPAAGPREMEVLYGYMVREGRAPDVLVVGLDPERLLGFTTDRLERSAAYEELTGRDRTVVAYAAIAATSFSRSYLRDTGKSLYRSHVAERPPAAREFRPDGSARYPSWEAAARDAAYDLDTAVDARMVNVHRRFGHAPEVDAATLARVERLVASASADGATVLVFFPPLHPRAVEELERDGTLTRVVDAARDVVLPLCGPTVHVFDLSHLDAFGGSPGDFRDAEHYTAPNAERIARVLLSGARDLCA